MDQQPDTTRPEFISGNLITSIKKILDIPPTQSGPAQSRRDDEDEDAKNLIDGIIGYTDLRRTIAEKADDSTKETWLKIKIELGSLREALVELHDGIQSSTVIALPDSYKGSAIKRDGRIPALVSDLKMQFNQVGHNVGIPIKNQDAVTQEITKLLKESTNVNALIHQLEPAVKSETPDYLLKAKSRRDSHGNKKGVDSIPR